MRDAVYLGRVKWAQLGDYWRYADVDALCIDVSRTDQQLFRLQAPGSRMLQTGTMVHSTEWCNVRDMLDTAPRGQVFLRAGNWQQYHLLAKASAEKQHRFLWLGPRFEKDSQGWKLHNQDVMRRISTLHAMCTRDWMIGLEDVQVDVEQRITSFLSDCGNSPSLFGLSRYGPVSFVPTVKDLWESYFDSRKRGGRTLTRPDIVFADAGWMTFSRERQRIVFLMAKGDELLPGLEFLQDLPKENNCTLFPQSTLSETDPVAFYHNKNVLYWQFDSSTERSGSGWTVWDALGLCCIYPSDCSTNGLTVKVTAVLGEASSMRPPKGDDRSSVRPTKQRRCPQKVHDLLVQHGISISGDAVPNEEVESDNEMEADELVQSHEANGPTEDDPESSLTASLSAMTTQEYMK